MGKQLIKKSDELIDKMREHDEELLALIKQGHRSMITQVIKDYLSSLE